MKIKKLLCSLAVLSTIGISFPAYTPASMVPGGRLVIHSQEEPQILSPLFNNSEAARSVYNLVYSGLVGIDDNFDYFPDLAVSVPTVANRGVMPTDNGMEVTYKLKDLAFWHDGVPVTSEDVRFTWQCYTNPAIKKTEQPNLEGYQKISRVETPDPKTVKIFFKEKYPEYNRLFRYILPKHGFIPRKLYNISPDHPFNKRPVGSGPFVFVEWKPGNRLVLDVNKRYYRPRPHLDQIVFTFGAINKNIAAGLEKGQIHLLQTKNNSSPDSVVNQAANVENIKVVQLDIEEMAFNTESSFLRDINLRKAIAHVINREKIAGRFENLQATWTDTHPNSAIFDQGLKEAYAYDLNMAQYLLDRAGWTVDERDGLRKSKDQPLVLKLVMTDTPVHQATAAYLGEMLSYLGISLEVKATAEKDWDELTRNTDAYDLALYARRIAVSGAERAGFFSQKQLPPSGRNYSRLNNQRLEAIFSDTERITSPSEQKVITEILKEEVPVLPLFSYIQRIAVSSKLNNFRPNLLYGNTWNSSEWWLN